MWKRGKGLRLLGDCPCPGFADLGPKRYLVQAASAWRGGVTDGAGSWLSIPPLGCGLMWVGKPAGPRGLGWLHAGESRLLHPRGSSQVGFAGTGLLSFLNVHWDLHSLRKYHLRPRTVLVRDPGAQKLAPWARSTLQWPQAEKRGAPGRAVSHGKHRQPLCQVSDHWICPWGSSMVDVGGRVWAHLGEEGEGRRRQ